MKEENAIIEVPTNEVTVLNQYDKLIEVGFESNADLDRMERLFELKKEYEANEARKAFHLAMAEFKKTPLHIPKTKFNSQFNSYYVDIGVLVNIAVPELAKNNLSHKWVIDQSSGVSVECVATHALGFSGSVSMVAPPDTSGKKNQIQEIKSTITYLKAVTFESIFGLASSDANLSDDGNGSSNIKLITEEQEADLLSMIEEKKVDLSKFLKHFSITKLSELWSSNYKTAVEMVEAKK